MSVASRLRSVVTVVAVAAVSLAGFGALSMVSAGYASSPAVVASRSNASTPGAGTVREVAPSPTSPPPPAAPDSTVTTAPPATVAPAVPAPRASLAAGATVGSQSYAVPADAIVVANTGSDAAPGTEAQPLLTVGRALEVAPAGATIVLRAGSYHESLTVTSTVTIQAWPGEVVWFEGSAVVSTWVPDGARWRSDGWTIEFDSSPTYTRGAPDSTEPNWAFVDPGYPMAAHPDQIWIDDVAQLQVGSLDAVVAGTFFHDEAADLLYLGSDPTGHEVRVSDLVRAMAVRAENVVLRGFGIRRYAPSVPDIGAVTLERSGIVIEQVAITDSATTGLSVIAAAITVRNVSIARSGMLGMHGNNADGIVIEGLVSEDNNVEHFNSAPVSGGTKITRSRNVTVRNSIFRRNLGPGLWMDESVHDMYVLGNEVRDNTGHGVSLEISANAVFADNIVQGNSGFGVKVNNTSDVTIWNNTFVGNGRTINLLQDDRRYGDGSPGEDPRYPGDPTMTWLLGPVTVANNVIANPTTADCLLCVEDYSKQRTAEQIGVTADGNVYNRPSNSSPEWAVIWSRGADDPAVYTTLDEFTAATGNEADGVLITGSEVVTAAGVATQYLPPDDRALPLPNAVAVLLGRPDGARHLGAW